MPRVELKFIVSRFEYENIKSMVSAWLEPDPFSNQAGYYPVLSTYFDTSNLDFFYQKINGELNHCKIRFRRYNAFSHFFETKWKSGDFIRKTRTKVDSFQTDFVQHLEASGYHDLPSLIPICDVYYEREAWVGGVSGEILRVNFDHNLSWQKPMAAANYQDEDYRLLPAFWSILEVKYDSEQLPPEMRAILRKSCAEQVTFSKYALAVEAMGRLYDFEEVIL